MAPTLTAPALAGTRKILLTEPIDPGTLIALGQPGRHERSRVDSCTGSGPYTVTLVYGGPLRHGHPAGVPVAVVVESVRA